MPEALVSREVENLVQGRGKIRVSGIEVEPCGCGCGGEAILFPRMNQLMRFIQYYPDCNSFTFVSGNWVADTQN